MRGRRLMRGRIRYLLAAVAVAIVGFAAVQGALLAGAVMESALLGCSADSIRPVIHVQNDSGQQVGVTRPDGQFTMLNPRANVLLMPIYRTPPPWHLEVMTADTVLWRGNFTTPTLGVRIVRGQELLWRRTGSDVHVELGAFHC